MAARTSTTRPQIALTNPKLAELLVVAGGAGSVTAGKVAVAVSRGVADDRSLKTCTVGAAGVVVGFWKLEIVIET